MAAHDDDRRALAGDPAGAAAIPGAVPVVAVAAVAMVTVFMVTVATPSAIPAKVRTPCARYMTAPRTVTIQVIFRYVPRR